MPKFMSLNGEDMQDLLLEHFALEVPRDAADAFCEVILRWIAKPDSRPSRQTHRGKAQ